MGRVLAIDWGETRIGFAISNSEQGIAFPRDGLDLSSIPKSQRLRYFIEYLDSLLNQEQIKAIVLGYPKTLSDTKSEQTKRVDEIHQVLCETLDVPIMLWDEAFSSKEAKELLRNRGITHKKRKSKIDSHAARIFLQSYLDAHHPSSC
jgi:putative holliday junction resolvase